MRSSGRFMFDRDSQNFRTFGRAKGRTLSPQMRTIYDANFPGLKWSDENPLGPDGHTGPVWLEIGFGGAEHLLWQAEAHPDVHIIGAEPFLNGVAKAVRGVVDAKLTNVTLHRGDVRQVLDVIPDGSLDRIFVLFPDPWPKARHNKRRILRTAFIAELHRVLRPGGTLRFASDIIHYVDWTLTRLHRHGGWDWPAETQSDWRTRSADWPGTRYEAKAGREGRSCHYFEFVRTPTIG